jgi:hypothetical protein
LETATGDGVSDRTIHTKTINAINDLQGKGHIYPEYAAPEIKPMKKREDPQCPIPITRSY